MLNILIFGPPGSGKGTQSLRISDKYGLSHISTGDILRNEVDRQTSLGKKAGKIMDRGELVPDELLIDILHSMMEKNRVAKGFIFDGFPRTIVQAKELDALMEKLNNDIHIVISLEVPDEEVVARLLKRAELEGRTDDNRETVGNRLKIYNQQTAPLLDYYSRQGKLRTVKGVGRIDEIFKDVSSIIDKELSTYRLKRNN